MPSPPRPSDVAIAAATLAYTANVALGAAVAARLVDTRRRRWLHHALYVATCVTTGTAVAVGTVRGERAALALVPAAVPLALLARQGARPLGRHARTALTAAPCYLAAGVLSRRRTPRS